MICRKLHSYHYNQAYSYSSRLLHAHVALSHPDGVSSTDVNPNSPPSIADPSTGVVGSGRPRTSHVTVNMAYLLKKHDVSAIARAGK